MREVETTGKTVAAAVAVAVEQLRVARDQVEVEVLEEGRGFFGLLSQPARVRVRVKEGRGALGPEAAAWLQRTLDGVGLTGRVVLQRETAETIFLDLETDDSPGVFIGRGGDMLAAFGLLIAAIINRDQPVRKRVEVDVDGYRQRREDALRREVKAAAREARTRNRQVSLQPMPAHERRLVHVLLSEESGVVSTSVGRDPHRRVVIASTRTPRGREGGPPPRSHEGGPPPRSREGGPPPPSREGGPPPRGREGGPPPPNREGGPPPRSREGGPPPPNREDGPPPPSVPPSQGTRAVRRQPPRWRRPRPRS